MSGRYLNLSGGKDRWRVSHGQSIVDHRLFAARNRDTVRFYRFDCDLMTDRKQRETRWYICTLLFVASSFAIDRRYRNTCAAHTVLLFLSSLPPNTRPLEYYHVAENLIKNLPITKGIPSNLSPRWTFLPLFPAYANILDTSCNVYYKEATKTSRSFVYFYISFRLLCFFFHVNYSHTYTYIHNIQPTKKKHLSYSWH